MTENEPTGLMRLNALGSYTFREPDHFTRTRLPDLPEHLRQVYFSVAENMRQLQLEPYVDSMDGLWLGLAKSEVHPHDRWLFYSPNGAVAGFQEMPTWFRYDMRHHDWSWVASLPTQIHALTITLKNLTSMRKLNQQTSLTPAQTMVLRSLMLSDQEDRNRITAHITPTASWSELHGVLYHPITWQRDLPGEALPGELLLRMHGMSAYPHLASYALD